MKKIFANVKGILGVALLAGFFVSCNSSRRVVGIEEGWEILGESKVNFVRDKDEIEVRNRNQFTAIRFRVEDRDIRINDLKVSFINGDKLEPALDDAISADQMSRVIELGMEGRYLDRIEFKYRTTGNILKGRAKVLVLGRRYTPGY